MTGNRVEKIEACLRDAFDVRFLQTKDQSHLHAGHAGARDGKGHYDVTISARELDGLSRVEGHRRVYSALGSLMESDIHALRLSIRPADSDD